MNTESKSIRKTLKESSSSQSEHFIWATGASLSFILLMIIALVTVILVNGLGYFAPGRVARLELNNGKTVMGEISHQEEKATGERLQLKVANRDIYGIDFRWLERNKVKKISFPDDIFVLERTEYGNFIGLLKGIITPEGKLPDTSAGSLSDRRNLVEREYEKIKEKQDDLFALTTEIKQKQEEILALEYALKRGELVEKNRLPVLEKTISKQKGEFDILNREITEFTNDLRKHRALFAEASGETKEIALLDIVRAYQPNKMSLLNKIGFYLAKIFELLWDEPRESNTEGGLFPAIYGTVMLVLIMSFFCVPLGVIAAVYLREYAKEGTLVRLVRIAVYNLAGVPSIVYGIFGLGFFIYGIGGVMDELFFPERLPTPTWGTGGIFWASLTLSLLTLPVVIVATEEALSTIPKSIREGSFSLGATKFQTIYRVLLPMASPGIITGLILSMARAAGEVAPLMITGVVKLAPTLPLDGQFPFLHLDRKFMHLGFHIYDVGFQSPNVEAAKPMVFVTTLLLLLVVILLSLTAILLRNKMRKKLSSKAF